MLKACILMFLLAFPPKLICQTRYGFLLPDSSIISTTSISNILYVGIDNRLEIDSLLIFDFDSVLLKCNNGVLLFDSTYFTIPHRAGNLRIEVHGYKNSIVDTLGFCNFKVLPLPPPKIAFDNSMIEDNMQIALNTFIKADSLYIVISDDIPESRNWIQIREFSLGFNYGGYFIGATSGNNSITNEMKNLVLTKGTGRWFSVKVITQSATSLLLTNPIYRVFFY